MYIRFKESQTIQKHKKDHFLTHQPLSFHFFLTNEDHILKIFSKYLAPQFPEPVAMFGNPKAFYVNFVKKDDFYCVTEKEGRYSNWYLFDSCGNVYRHPPESEICFNFIDLSNESPKLKSLISTEYSVYCNGPKYYHHESFRPGFHLKDLKPIEIKEIYAQHLFHYDPVDGKKSHFYFGIQKGKTEVPRTISTSKENRYIFENYDVYSYELFGKVFHFIPQPTQSSCGYASIAMLALSFGLTDYLRPGEGMWDKDVVKDINTYIIKTLNQKEQETRKHYDVTHMGLPSLIAYHEKLEHSDLTDCEPSADILEKEKKDLIAFMEEHFRQFQSPLMIDIDGHYLIVDDVNVHENFALIREPFHAIHAKVNLDFIKRNIIQYFGVIHTDQPD